MFKIVILFIISLNFAYSSYANYSDVEKCKFYDKDKNENYFEVPFLLEEIQSNNQSEENVKILNVKKIDCTGVKIKKLPLALIKFSNLEIFYLTSCGLEELPVMFFSYFPKLKELSLRGNKLKDEDLKDIIFEESNYTLQRLDISYNNLKKFPAFISNFKDLRELYLRHNDIKEIPDFLCKNKDLNILVLSDNDIKEIPKCFSTFEKLETLLLDMNNLRECPDFLGDIKTLKNLDLSANLIFKKIPDKVEKHNNFNNFIF